MTNTQKNILATLILIGLIGIFTFVAMFPKITLTIIIYTLGIGMLMLLWVIIRDMLN